MITDHSQPKGGYVKVENLHNHVYGYVRGDAPHNCKAVMRVILATSISRSCDGVPQFFTILKKQIDISYI